MKKFLIFIILCLMILGCDSGSSGGGGDESNNPVGVWYGNSSDNRQGLVIVDNQGDFYMFYSPRNTDLSNSLGGVVIGSGSSKEQKYTSTNSRDYNISNWSVSRLNIFADFIPYETMTGVSTYINNGGTSTVTVNYSGINDKETTIQNISGQFLGQVAAGGAITDVTFFVYSDGSFSGGEEYGCVFSGKIKPKQNGNVFSFNIKFGQDCYFPGQTLSGTAIYVESTNTLLLAAPNANKEDGFAFIGGKM